MTPIKPLEEDLTETLGDWGFPAFESTIDGHIRLDGLKREDLNPEGYAYDFYMRVGLHMGQPLQVIMSCGKFIKMRKTDKWDPKTYNLVKLDPANPESNLYFEYDSMGLIPQQNYQQRIQYYPQVLGNGTIQPTAQLTPTLPIRKRGWRPQLPDYTVAGGFGQAMNIPTQTTILPYVTTAAGTGTAFPCPTIMYPQAVTTTTGQISMQGLGLTPSLPGIK